MRRRLMATELLGRGGNSLLILPGGRFETAADCGPGRRFSAAGFPAPRRRRDGQRPGIDRSSRLRLQPDSSRPLVAACRRVGRAQESRRRPHHDQARPRGRGPAARYGGRAAAAAARGGGRAGARRAVALERERRQAAAAPATMAPPCSIRPPHADAAADFDPLWGQVRIAAISHGGTDFYRSPETLALLRRIEREGAPVRARATIDGISAALLIFRFGNGYRLTAYQGARRWETGVPDLLRVGPAAAPGSTRPLFMGDQAGYRSFLPYAMPLADLASGRIVGRFGWERIELRGGRTIDLAPQFRQLVNILDAAANGDTIFALVDLEREKRVVRIEATRYAAGRCARNGDCRQVRTFSPRRTRSAPKRPWRGPRSASRRIRSRTIPDRSASSIGRSAPTGGCSSISTAARPPRWPNAPCRGRCRPSPPSAFRC